MFKKFVLPAVALVAITSCSSDEVLNTNSNPDGKDYISFNTVVGNNSRGEVTTIESLKGGFYVAAYGDNSMYFHRSAAKYKTETMEDNQSVTAWFLDDKYYWPSYTLRFAAWYPATLPSDGTKGSWTAVTGAGLTASDYVSRPDFSTDNDAARHKINGFSLPTTLDNQVDIVIARTEADKNKGANGVNLNFKHIFSQIEVRAKYAGELVDGKSKTKIEIAGVALRFVPNKGTFIFPTGVTDATGGSDLTIANWNIDKTKRTYEGNAVPEWKDDASNNFDLARFEHDFSNIELTKDNVVSLNSGINNFLVIPQNISDFAWTETLDGKPDGAYLALKVKISQLQAEDYHQIYPKESSTSDYAWMAVGLFNGDNLGTLEPGKHYTVTLTFNDDSAGKVDPTEPDPEPYKPGEDILGKQIYFNVAVDPWTPMTFDYPSTTTPGA